MYLNNFLQLLMMNKFTLSDVFLYPCSYKRHGGPWWNPWRSDQPRPDQSNHPQTQNQPWLSEHMGAPAQQRSPPATTNTNNNHNQPQPRET